MYAVIYKKNYIGILIISITVCINIIFYWTFTCKNNVLNSLQSIHRLVFPSIIYWENGNLRPIDDI